jgi:hypothetical protein
MAERMCQDETDRQGILCKRERKSLHRSIVNLLLRKYSAPLPCPLLAHPHMPRHACGFALADQGARHLQSHYAQLLSGLISPGVRDGPFLDRGSDNSFAPASFFQLGLRSAVPRTTIFHLNLRLK